MYWMLERKNKILLNFRHKAEGEKSHSRTNLLFCRLSENTEECEECVQLTQFHEKHLTVRLKFSDKYPSCLFDNKRNQE